MPLREVISEFKARTQLNSGGGGEILVDRVREIRR
jgi:hypothetical protein